MVIRPSSWKTGQVAAIDVQLGNEATRRNSDGRVSESALVAAEAGMNEPTRWFLMEGLLPLIGASVLFLAQATARFVVQTERSGFRFGFKEMLDGPAWLYGAAVLAIQQAGKAQGHNDCSALGWFCYGAAAGSALIVMAGLEERRRDDKYRPPTSVHIVAIILMTIVLGSGYRIQCLVLKKSDKGSEVSHDGVGEWIPEHDDAGDGARWLSCGRPCGGSDSSSITSRSSC
jgi:hypothetical protein